MLELDIDDDFPKSVKKKLISTIEDDDFSKSIKKSPFQPLMMMILYNQSRKNSKQVYFLVPRIKLRSSNSLSLPRIKPN